MIVLHALGQCLIRTAVGTITPRADTCFALASYLTHERGKRIPRRYIEKLFWPGMRAVDASHSLSELIHKLRRRGVPIERDEASCIWLARDAATVDVEALTAEPVAAIAARDLSVLPGYVPRVSPALKDWVDDLRGGIELRVLDTVIAGIAQSSADGDWGSTLALANKALGIDPRNETALLARARAADHLTRYDSPPRLSDTDPPPPRLHERPVRAPAAARTQTSLTDDTALVGREREMHCLREQANRAFQGHVSSAFISGPAGVGKSRLVREMSAWAADRGAVACTVSCARHDSRRPLSAFVQAVPQLRQLPGAAGCAPETMACLVRITQLSADPGDTHISDDSPEPSHSIRAAVIDLIDAIAHEQPLVLIVEDVHWIDGASWSLLRTIAATAERSLLIICTSRGRWQRSSWGEPDGFIVQELAPLDAAAARTHALNCLTRLHRSTDDAFIEWCVETAAGNSYFLEELINFWIATGEQYTAPPSLIALLEARLACLAPNALRVIQAAAILGKNSSLDMLQQLLEFPTHVLLTSIEELGDAGLLAPMPRMPQMPQMPRIPQMPPVDADAPACAAPVLCRHDLISRTATRALSTPGRALLHQAAACAIERTVAQNGSAELLWDCADHWRAAGQPGRSIRAVAACARQLHDMGLVHDAVKCCEAALATCGNDPRRNLLLRAMAQSQYAARDWTAFCSSVTQIRSLEANAHTQSCVHDDLELCELSAQRSLHRDWDGALKTTLRCVYALDADPPHRVQAAITALKLATNIGALATMDAVYETVGPLVSAPDVRANDRLTLAMIYHTIRGDSATGAESARELLRVATLTLPLPHRLPVMVNCISALRRGGQAGETESLCEEIFRLSVPLQCVDHAVVACDQLIQMYVDSGQPALAARWVAKYLELGRPRSELRARNSLRVAIARNHIYNGEWDATRKLLGSVRTAALWEDPVAMLRGAALATNIRLEISRGAPRERVEEFVVRLAPLSAVFRTVGAQDYETFSLYLGYRHIGAELTARDLLETYIDRERRDGRPPSPEIADELERLRLGA